MCKWCMCKRERESASLDHAVCVHGAAWQTEAVRHRAVKFADDFVNGLFPAGVSITSTLDSSEELP